MLPQTSLSPSTGEAAQPALPGNAPSHGPDTSSNAPVLIEPSPAPGCVGPSGSVEDPHLRHLIIGSPADVQDALALGPVFRPSPDCTCCTMSKSACGPH
ncbi:MAG: hypothetical protein WBA10_11680 [Elainellaceae cyanobacterium]